MELILKYFPDITETQRRQFAALYDLYAGWNAKINVVSRKDFDQLTVFGYDIVGYLHTRLSRRSSMTHSTAAHSGLSRS